MYYLFSGLNYYPSGGWGDFIGTFDTIEEARARVVYDPSYNWYQIVHVMTLTVVDENGETA